VNRTLSRGDQRYEAQIRAGHPDLQRLYRALLDWSAELSLLRASRGLATGGARLAHARFYRAKAWRRGQYRCVAVKARNGLGIRSVIGQPRKDKQENDSDWKTIA